MWSGNNEKMAGKKFKNKPDFLKEFRKGIFCFLMPYAIVVNAPPALVL